MSSDPRNRSGDSLLEKLRRLRLDPDHFVIFGSAPLLVHGLRTDVHDLDVLARGSAWERVEASGKQTFGRVTGDPLHGFYGGRIQFSQHWISGDYDTDALIEGAEVVDGLRFARLEEVLSYKVKLGRRKDLRDIEAIERHLALQAPVPAGCGR
jgi:hypothetical protein